MKNAILLSTILLFTFIACKKTDDKIINEGTADVYEWTHKVFPETIIKTIEIENEEIALIEITRDRHCNIAGVGFEVIVSIDDALVLNEYINEFPFEKTIDLYKNSILTVETIYDPLALWHCVENPSFYFKMSID